MDNGFDGIPGIPGIPYERGWQRLGEHTLAWLEPDGGWGLSNAGLVADGAEALLVDTLFDLPHTKAMLDSLRELAPDARIGAVVNTHANGDHFWGNQLLDGADIVVSAGTAGEMKHGFTAGPGLLEDIADNADSHDVLGAYMRDLNRDFDFTGIEPPAPTRVFSGSLELPVGHLTATAIDMGAQHSEGDTVVWVPEDRVLFTGDLLFIGVHPVMWAGPIDNWIATCQKLEELRPRIVVPGHGPLITADGIRDFREYLEHVKREATARYEIGMPWQEAAVDISLGRWSGWANPERLAVTVSSMYRDLAGRAADASTEEFARVMTATAGIAAGVLQKSRLRPLQPGERDSATAAVLTPDLPDGNFASYTADRPPLNVFTTLVRNPELFRLWAPLAAHLSNGSLPPEDRELAILRTAVRCGSPYEWTQHSALAAAAGLTGEEIARTARTTTDPQWSATQKAILDAVDELHATSTVSQHTWEMLAGHYTTAELIELIVLIGHYHEVAFALNAFKTPTDAWAAPSAFPAIPAN